jgi:hypothetical protein
MYVIFEFLVDFDPGFYRLDEIGLRNPVDIERAAKNRFGEQACPA